MTISIADNNPRIAYTATAGQTAFTVPFEFFDNSDLNVYINETLKTITTHYTVSGGSGSTGAIALETGATVNDKVVITRDVTLQRTTDFPSSGPFQVASLNTELDKLIAMMADLSDLAGRGIVLSDSDTTVSVTLPNVTGRAGKVLAFNSTTGAVEAGPTITATQTVADQAADIDTCATNISAITAAPTQATNAASSATSAAASASTATTKASEASTSASNASTSETNAASSATSAATNATTATTKASEASTSATNAASSASTSTTKASEAATSETNASTSASTATTKASEAATSATNAATSATTATTKATEAASSATAAASSATAAASSQTAAAASAASAASAFDNFDDTYLGSKTSNPTVDNDGDALVAGALYFNSTANEMRVYDGANWIAATSAGNVSLILYEYTATAGQTTFSGSDDNSATLSYTVDNLQVVMNGVVLDPADFAATNGTSVVLDSGATVGDQINIYAFKSFTTADMVSKTAGGTFSGAVGFGGGITGDVAFDTTTLKVDSTNNRVGVGTAAPAFALDVQSTGDPAQIRLKEDGNTNGVKIVNFDGDEAQINNVDNGPLVLKTNDTERMRISNDGKVGIGTNSPDAKLHVKDTAASTATHSYTKMHIEDADHLALQFSGGTSGETWIWFADDTTSTPVGGITYYHGGPYMAFRVESAERMRIDSDGNLLIGVTATGNNGAFFMPSSNNRTVLFLGTSTTSTSTVQAFRNSNGTVGTISVSGSATAFNTSSDYRLKENVTDITDGITRVKQLNPSRFNFKADADTKVDGFLAHEAQTVVPEAITGTKDETRSVSNAVLSADGKLLAEDVSQSDWTAGKLSTTDIDGNNVDALYPSDSTWAASHTEPEYQGIDQAKLVPVLTAALQEAIAKIETLETKVAALEAG